MGQVTRAFTEPAPLDKAHGARVVITYDDGSKIEDELRVANAHPMGERPFGRAEYEAKFRALAEPWLEQKEIERFLTSALKLADGLSIDLSELSIEAESTLPEAPFGLLD